MLKTSLKSIFVLLTLLLIFTACTKENDLLVMKENTMDAKIDLGSLKLLKDSEDNENDRANKILYLFTNAVIEASKNPALLDYMETAVKTDKLGIGVSIPELAAKNVDFASTVAQVLRKQLDSAPFHSLSEEKYAKDDVQIINVIAAKLISREKQYTPVIYTLIQSKTRPSVKDARDQGVIIAIAEEVTDEDEVLAFRNTEETPFLLDEKTAAASKEKIIFVGVGDIPGVDVTAYFLDQNRERNDSQELIFRADIDVDVDNHQIKAGYRYESSNKSEVVGWDLKYFDGLASNNPVHQWLDFDPRKIHKSDINASKIFTGDLNAFGFSPPQFNDGISVFIGAFEYDWYASGKHIANPCSSISGHGVFVQMKFSHEWYFYDCSVADNWWPNVGSKAKFENQKCMFEMKRTQ